jgi:class 3 adenylate cyclase
VIERMMECANWVMMETVHRYEGTVNQVLGDGIMALFGAPLTHEDHVLRACSSRMQASVNRYAEGARRTQGVNVQIRVGLNSGQVVVRAIGGDLHRDYTVVGQATHLAAPIDGVARARLQLYLSTEYRTIVA